MVSTVRYPLAVRFGKVNLMVFSGSVRYILELCFWSHKEGNAVNFMKQDSKPVTCHQAEQICFLGT